MTNQEIVTEAETLVARIEADMIALDRLMISAGAPFEDPSCNKGLVKLIRRFSRIRDDVVEWHADATILCKAGDPSVQFGGDK